MTLKQKYSLLFILGGLSALAPFSIDMYLPAFPSIAKGLGTNISQVAFSLTSYFLGISFGQLFYGPITDKYGRKKPLLFGLAVFFLAAVGCAVSPTIDWLIYMRVIMALGGCVGMVVSRAVVRDVFPVSETAKIFSTLMLITGVAPIIAPTVGSWILTVSTWRTIFYLLGAFSLILIISVYLYLPESASINKSLKLNPKGIFKDYKNVFTERSFLYFALASSIGMGGMFAYISGASFVFMNYFELSESTFGYIFSANAIGFIAGSQINRLLLNKYTSLQIITFASVILVCVSFAMLITYSLDLITLPVLVGLLITFLFSLGLLVPNSTAMALAPFKKSAGSASALIGFIQMLVGASISAAVSALHNDTILPMFLGMAFSGCGAFIVILMLNSQVKKGVLQHAYLKK